MAALPPRANTTSALPVAPSASSSAPSSSAVSSSLTDKQKEDALFKKFMQERTRKLEELQATHTVLARNVPADADSLAAANHVGRTKAAVAFSLLGDLIDECIYDVLFEAHREMKMASSVCQLCQTKCRSFITKPGCDIFGNSYNQNNLPSYNCVNCHKLFPAGRYAPHLEKCLGLAGRASSRVANRRMGSASPYTPVNYSEDNANASESDGTYGEKKRKKTGKPAQGAQTLPNKLPKLKKQKTSLLDVTDIPNSSQGSTGVVKTKSSKLSQTTTLQGTPVVVTTSAPSSPRSSSPARPSKSSAGRASTPDPSLLTPHVVRDLTKSPKNQRRSASPAPKAADLKRSLSAPTPPAGGRKDKERDRDKEKEREKNKEREGKDKDKEKEPRVPRKRPPGAEGTGVPAKRPPSMVRDSSKHDNANDTGSDFIDIDGEDVEAAGSTR